jgi:hypothetical protein
MKLTIPFLLAITILLAGVPSAAIAADAAKFEDRFDLLHNFDPASEILTPSEGGGCVPQGAFHAYGFYLFVSGQSDDDASAQDSASASDTSDTSANGDDSGDATTSDSNGDDSADDDDGFDVDFGLYSRIEYFSLTPDSVGNLQFPTNWNGSQFTSLAHRHASMVDLVVSNDVWDFEDADTVARANDDSAPNNRTNLPDSFASNSQTATSNGLTLSQIDFAIPNDSTQRASFPAIQTTETPTLTPTVTPAVSATSTATSVPATQTPSPTAVATQAATETPTTLPTATETPTPASVATNTPSAGTTETPAPTSAATNTPSAGAAETPTPSATDMTTTPAATAESTQIPGTGTPTPAVTGTPEASATPTGGSRSDQSSEDGLRLGKSYVLLNLIDEIVEVVEKDDFDGVAIDFSLPPDEQTTESYFFFIKRLKKRLLEIESPNEGLLKAGEKHLNLVIATEFKQSDVNNIVDNLWDSVDLFLVERPTLEDAQNDPLTEKQLELLVGARLESLPIDTRPEMAVVLPNTGVGLGSTPPAIWDISNGGKVWDSQLETRIYGTGFNLKNIASSYICPNRTILFGVLNAASPVLFILLALTWIFFEFPKWPRRFIAELVLWALVAVAFIAFLLLLFSLPSITMLNFENIGIYVIILSLAIPVLYIIWTSITRYVNRSNYP